MSRRTNAGLLVAVTGVLVAAITGLGAWKQTWTGIVTFADTPVAKWSLLVAAVAVVLFVGRELKRRIDANGRLRDELQATVILHQQVLLGLVSRVRDGAGVAEAVERGRREIEQRGIKIEEAAAVRRLVEAFEGQLNRNEMERLRGALQKAEVELAQQRTSRRDGAKERTQG